MTLTSTCQPETTVRCISCKRFCRGHAVNQTTVALRPKYRNKLQIFHQHRQIVGLVHHHGDNTCVHHFLVAPENISFAVCAIYSISAILPGYVFCICSVFFHLLHMILNGFSHAFNFRAFWLFACVSLKFLCTDFSFLLLPNGGKAFSAFHLNSPQILLILQQSTS